MKFSNYQISREYISSFKLWLVAKLHNISGRRTKFPIRFQSPGNQSRFFLETSPTTTFCKTQCCSTSHTGQEPPIPWTERTFFHFCRTPNSDASQHELPWESFTLCTIWNFEPIVLHPWDIQGIFVVTPWSVCWSTSKTIWRYSFWIFTAPPSTDFTSSRAHKCSNACGKKR